MHMRGTHRPRGRRRQRRRHQGLRTIYGLRALAMAALVLLLPTAC